MKEYKIFINYSKMIKEFSAEELKVIQYEEPPKIGYIKSFENTIIGITRVEDATVFNSKTEATEIALHLLTILNNDSFILNELRIEEKR